MSKNACHRNLTAGVDLQNSRKGERRELTLRSSLTSICTPLPTHTTSTEQPCGLKTMVATPGLHTCASTHTDRFTHKHKMDAIEYD